MRLYSYGILIWCLLACKNNIAEQVNIQSITPTQQVAKEKQYRYYIGMAVYLPFELYLDNILIKRGSTGVSSGVELNPWLLRNGTYTITLKLFPDVGETTVNMAKEQLPYRLDFSRVVLTDTKDIIEAKELANLRLVTTNEELPYFEQSWEIKVKNLPYELEGWSNGQDLSKWDKEVLQKKVVAYYEKLRTILNNGDVELWYQLDKQRDYETYIFNYTSKEKIQRKFNENSTKIKEECKGNMLPLENYKMKIYGKYNQLVTLERIATNDFEEWEETGEGWSPLITIFDEDYIANYPVKLYLTEASNEFVIIRK